MPWRRARENGAFHVLFVHDAPIRRDVAGGRPATLVGGHRGRDSGAAQLPGAVRAARAARPAAPALRGLALAARPPLRSHRPPVFLESLVLERNIDSVLV